MKRLVALSTLLIGITCQAQTAWQPVFSDQQGTRYELANTQRPINSAGEITFIMRGLFRQPVILQTEAEQHITTGFMMAIRGICGKSLAQIVQDVHVTIDGRPVLQDVMTKDDTMSEVNEQGPIGAALKIACDRSKGA